MKANGFWVALFLGIAIFSLSSNAATIPFDSITPSMIRATVIADSIIDGSDSISNMIPNGAIVFYKTKNGRYGKFKVLNYGYNMWLRIVTYNSNGSVYAQGDSVMIRGTFRCNLDSAAECPSLAQADFHWNQMTSVFRLIEAKNGARFAVYFSPSNVVTNITMKPASPSVLKDSQHVTVSFTYKTNITKASIWFAPISHRGTLWVYTPGSLWHSFSISQPGSDTGSTYFTIDTGSVNVDSVYVIIMDSTYKKFFDTYIPVSYFFTPDTNGNYITHITMDPPSPAQLNDTHYVLVSFTYRINAASGARISCLPITHGLFSPNAAVSGSFLINPGTGTNGRLFTITQGSVVVDSIHVIMTDSANTKTLFEWYVPVSYSFSEPVSVNAAAGQPLPDKNSVYATSDWNIHIALNQAADVEIRVYNAGGRCLKTIADGYMAAGYHQYRLQGASGVLFVRSTINGRVSTSKIFIGK
jgi:hypothetical protein